MKKEREFKEKKLLEEKEKQKQEREYKKPLSTNLTKSSMNNAIPKKENIILNQRLIQRFYAYSVLDFYSKYFKINADPQSTDYDEESNIYLNKENCENTTEGLDKGKRNLGKGATRGKSVGYKNKSAKSIMENKLNNVKSR